MLNDNNVYIIHKEDVKYPQNKRAFRPMEMYPETPFDEISEENQVYSMVREGFHLMGLDSKNYGKSTWNPLGKYVKPNDTVLIKPNLVLHKNHFPDGGEECLYTQPSVVAAVVDYVILAQKGKGRIIIGDAPLQECVFEELLRSSGYDYLVEYYRDKGINIEIKDFRNTKTYMDNDSIHYQQESAITEGKVIVKMANESAFSDLDDERLQMMRVGNYDPRIMNKHHMGMTHEYAISETVLNADVIINMPKPKTHRYAGITAALKNMIGINVYKEWVPHYTFGTSANHQDTYKHRHLLLDRTNEYLDKKNIANKEEKYEEAREYSKEYIQSYEIGRLETGERYWSGAWYGNDTLWRSIIDLNKALFYADSENGYITEGIKRRYLIIGDMIIGGQKDGPLSPTPKETGIIVMAENPCKFDRVISSLMGFDYRLMPSLNNDETTKRPFNIEDDSLPIIHSNDKEYESISLDDLRLKCAENYIPSQGWEVVLGEPKKEELLRVIENSTEDYIIFGAGTNGLDIYFYLLEMNPDIRIVGFFDNDEKKWGKKVARKIEIQKPHNVKGKLNCLVSVGKGCIDEIKAGIEEYEFKNILYLVDYLE